MRLIRSHFCLHVCAAVHSPKQLFVCIFVAAATRIPSHCLSTTVSSSFTIPAFSRNVTLHSNVVGRDVFYAIPEVSNTQYVGKGQEASNITKSQRIHFVNMGLLTPHTFVKLSAPFHPAEMNWNLPQVPSVHLFMFVPNPHFPCPAFVRSLS